jgi:hypothetical protein
VLIRRHLQENLWHNVCDHCKKKLLHLYKTSVVDKLNSTGCDKTKFREPVP